MKEKTNLFSSYLVQHKKSAAFFALCAAIFAVEFYLYNLPLEAVMYGFTLCFFFGFIALLYDFYGFYKKISALEDMKRRITLSLHELPEPKNLMEWEYFELLSAVHEDKIQKITALDNSRREIADYYTLWAHQIKTPISAMRLLLQSEEDINPDEISMELFKIEQYVAMVLQYIRLDSSSTDFVIKEYDLDDIVKQSVRKYAKIFVHKKLKLEFSELQSTVLTDEKWLLFVIEQILSNSLKYTVRGGISIYTEGIDHKILVIEDTGIGIKEEDLPRVFENGFTGYNGRADKKSTGIGLYLCRKILSKLSHKIQIESKAGRGTKVKINFENIKVEVE
jgi:signal transduction histidine kinase